MSNMVLMMDNRQLIPRWHTSRKIFNHNYSISNNNELVKDHGGDYWFNKSVDRWKTNPSDSNAIDVFVRLVQNDNKSHRLFNVVQKQLLEIIDILPSAVRNIVLPPKLKLLDNSTGYEINPNRVGLIIKKLKNIVRHFPNDSLSWMDLGFYYSIIGQNDKANYCSEVAKNLDPNHPFIARSFSRFLVHSGDPERASWFLKNRPNLYSNPLILSAYIAISTAFDLGNPNVKKAIKLIENWSRESALISELAACVGTIEYGSGSIIKSKKHFRLSMSAPSENVIAHLRWLRHKHNFKFNNIPSTIQSIEGDLNELYNEMNFDRCRDKLLEMYSFQPYSIGPIVDAGYLSITALNDPQFTIDLSNNRIPLSHMSFPELNNLIVAELMLKKKSNIDFKLKLLRKRMNPDSVTDLATFSATCGMAMLVDGFINAGKELYEKSISLLHKSGNFRTLCIAKHFYSEQLKEIDIEKSMILKNESLKLAKKYRVLEFI